MSGRRRRGLVLVEVVSGAGILLLLVALQLPAITKAREAARRSQCVNNLKQIALATHNYVATNDVFPMSAVIGPGRGNGQGCFTQILPFMEQVAAYNAYNFHLENWHVANGTAVGLKMSSFLCPSNKRTEPTAATGVRTQHGGLYPGKSEFAASHYAANWGGVREASGAELMVMYPDPKKPGSHLGVILTVVDPDAAEPTRNIGLRDMTDGTSNTIAYGEKLDSFGWAVGGWGGTEFDVNSSISYDGKDATLRRVFTGSDHPDGVNIALADGSVLFIKPTIDRKLWYGMTTRAGGEQIFDEVMKLRK